MRRCLLGVCLAVAAPPPGYAQTADAIKEVGGAAPLPRGLKPPPPPPGPVPQPPVPRIRAAAEPTSSDAAPPPTLPKLDASGDPLPPGAVGRFGSVRFQHLGNVSWSRFTPDGRTLFTFSEADETVRAWDARTGRGRGRLTVNAAELAVGPGGGVWVVEAGRVRYWKPGADATPAPGDLATAAAGGTPHGVAVSADGRRVAVWFNAGVAVYDAATGKKAASLKAPRRDNGPAVMGFSPDGNRLAADDGKTGVCVWDVRAAKRERTLPVEGGVVGLAFSPDGSRLAVAADKFHLFAADADEPAEGFDGPAETIHAVHFAADGKSLLGLTESAAVVQVDARTGAKSDVSAAPGQGFTPAALAPDGAAAAGVDERGAVRVWDGKTGEEFGPGRHPPLKRVWLSPDGKTAECVDEGNVVRPWDVATGKPGPTRKLPPTTGPWAWQRAAGRAAVVSGDEASAVEVVDTRTAKSLLRVPVPADKGEATFDLSAADPDRLAVAWQGRAAVMDVPTGRTLRTFDLPDDGPTAAVVFSPDGRLVATPTAGRLLVWETSTGLKRFDLPADPIPQGAHFSPDGRWLAAIGGDGTAVALIDVRKGTVARKLRPPEDGLATAVGFSRDGRRVAVGTTDGALRVFDTRSGESTFAAAGHGEAVNDLAFTADGSKLVSASEDGTALVWDATARVEAKPSGPPPLAGPDEAVKSLADPDAAVAGRGIAYLCDHPTEAAKLLAERVPAPAAVKAADLKRLVADLDGDYPTRTAAAKALREIGGPADAALRAAVESAGSAEVRKTANDLLARRDAPPTSGDELRALRAVEVLEAVGTADARTLLAKWAAGPPGHRLTTEAAAAVGRLAPRSPPESP